VSASTADADRLAELEDERRFLLASLTDLEREHEAGDIDDGDYETLKDGYTARAAAVLRAIDEGRRALPPRPRRQWGRIVVAIGALAVVALGLGLLVAHFAGQRLPGQTVSGGIAEDTNSRLAQARALLGTDPARSLLLYEAIKEVDPDNVEATTYLGWLLSIQAANTGSADSITQAEGLLDDAIALDPQRADAYCFKAVVRFRFLGDAATARTALDQCAALHPPAEVTGLVHGLSEEIDAALAGGAPATTASAAPAATSASPATTASATTAAP
jgi:hypothetical protein